MITSLVETISRIKKAGTVNVRTVPMQGQSVINGLYQIEIKENNKWSVIAEGLPQSTANDIIKQASSRLICG